MVKLRSYNKNINFLDDDALTGLNLHAFLITWAWSEAAIWLIHCRYIVDVHSLVPELLNDISEKKPGLQPDTNPPLQLAPPEVNEAGALFAKAVTEGTPRLAASIRKYLPCGSAVQLYIPGRT